MGAICRGKFTERLTNRRSGLGNVVESGDAGGVQAIDFLEQPGLQSRSQVGLRRDFRQAASRVKLALEARIGLARREVQIAEQALPVDRRLGRITDFHDEFLPASLQSSAQRVLLLSYHERPVGEPRMGRIRGWVCRFFDRAT